MLSLQQDISLQKIKREDLDKLEEVFIQAFSGGLYLERLRKRIKRIRQFYFVSFAAFDKLG